MSYGKCGDFRANRPTDESYEVLIDYALLLAVSGFLQTSNSLS